MVLYASCTCGVSHRKRKAVVAATPQKHTAIMHTPALPAWG